MVAEQPSFEDFYRAINGREPFRWQTRLAAQLIESGAWPREIGVPTGLGKTACLDIGIWWMASQAERAPHERTTPRRLWWLVNRRLLVDATADHANGLAEALRNASDPLQSGAVALVAQRLAHLAASPDSEPLEVVRLRGGAATGRPTDPSQPSVLLATLPMYGSRLLFRGYGSSRSMRPIDAALAGTDSLVLIDEAHLAHHLMNLFTPLAECEAPEAEILPESRQRPVVVALTATGSSPVEHRFDLDEADRSESLVQKRLEAKKPTRIVEVAPGTNPSKTLVSEAELLLAVSEAPTSCLVFVNTPDMAREVATTMAKRLGPDVADIVVLTGRQREREAHQARAHILDTDTGAPAARVADVRSRHLVVVATQTLEVGADVDFEHLVTEACGVRSLTQRLGRLNRLGNHDHAKAVYIHAEPSTSGGADPSWPVYGTEPLCVLDRLRSSAVEDVVQLGPAVVADVLGPPGDDPGRGPEILPAILSEWVKTTCPPAGEAPVEPYFSGLANPTYRVSVCWRAFIPDDECPLWPRIREAETIDLPLRSIRDTFDRADSIHRLASDRTSLERVVIDDLRPGDTIVFGTDLGKMDKFGWNPEAVEPVVDVSLAEQGLPLDGDALVRLVDKPPAARLAALLQSEEAEDEPGLVMELVTQLRRCSTRALPSKEWEEFLDDLDLRRGVVRPPGEVARLMVEHPTRSARADAYDELSAAARTAVELDAHGTGVASRTTRTAEALGIDPTLIATLGRSARFHDTGKADPRFQRWLDPQAKEPGLVAKSTTPRSKWEGARIASGWPRGGRHEELSGRLVLAWVRDQPQHVLGALDLDLLMHLVISHHGHGRPLLSPVADSTAKPVVGILDGSTFEVSADLGEMDWTQPDRFWRLAGTYGHWGLALLEAVVRQSDHAVSAGGWAGPTEEIL